MNNESKKIQKTKLKEFGPILPLGIDENGILVRDLAVKRWTFKQEKELGELKEENSDVNLGRYVSMVLATMCTRLGPYDFEKMDFNQKILTISQMWAGDVLYAYCWLRYKSLGKEIGMTIQCPHPSCNNKIDYVADMETMEISHYDSLDDFLWDYELKEPFEIRGEEVNGFVIRPMRWNTYETITNDSYGGEGDIKSKVILNSIHSILGKGEQTILAENEIEEMGKKDIELIPKAIEEKNLGPDLSVEVKCNKCRNKFVHQISWSYHDFFGSSSR